MPRARGGFGGRDLLREPVGQPVAPADHLQPHALVGEAPQVAPQVLAQQQHQHLDLERRAPPVVGREREQRQRADAEIGRGLDHAAHRLDAFAVTGAARQAAPLAQRPLPSMMIATCRPLHVALRLLAFESTLHCKVSPQNFFRLVFESAGSSPPRPALRGARRVAHHLLEHLEIFEIALPPGRRDAADGLRAVVVVALLDRDQPRFLQHLQMTREIAVGQAAHLLQVAEHEALGMRDQRGQHARGAPSRG